jgi:quercetin dioxygenase-like cupin family protein
MPTLALEEYPETNRHLHDATRHYSRAGTSIHVKATACETNRAHSLIELTIPAHLSIDPAHFHKTFIESLYILEGEILLTRGDEVITASASSLTHIPIDMPHSYRNATGRRARVLVICTPGGHDAFFIDLIAKMQREPQWPPSDRNALIAFGLKHDTHYL